MNRLVHPNEAKPINRYNEKKPEQDGKHYKKTHQTDNIADKLNSNAFQQTF